MNMSGEQRHGAVDESQPSDRQHARVIDTHAHVLPRLYTNELLAASEVHQGLASAAQMVKVRVPNFYPPACGTQLFGGADLRLEAMNAAGVDVQVLSAGSLTAFAPSTPTDVRRDLVRLWNDSAADYADEDPQRLQVFCAVPLPSVEYAVNEVKRVAGRPTTAGFGITTHIGGRPIDDPEWWPLYQLWNDMKATVFVHPDRFCVEGIMPRHLETDLGTQFDDTLATVRLYESVTHRFPGITWIVSHLGGAFPFVLGRLEEHWVRDREWRDHKVAPSQSLDNIMFDTAGHGGDSIEFAVRVLGAERVLFGTDFPMVSPESLAEQLHAVVSAIPAPGDQRRVLHENAARLLNL
jgi:aminocarboxymuconate-semialdehyde decarboxylase